MSSNYIIICAGGEASATNESSNYIIICVGGEVSATNESSNYSSLGTRSDTPYDVLKIYENTPQIKSKGYIRVYVLFYQDYYGVQYWLV